jgi:hypothetical protein
MAVPAGKVAVNMYLTPPERAELAATCSRLGISVGQFSGVVALAVAKLYEDDPELAASLFSHVLTLTPNQSRLAVPGARG